MDGAADVVTAPGPAAEQAVADAVKPRRKPYRRKPRTGTCQVRLLLLIYKPRSTDACTKLTWATATDAANISEQLLPIVRKTRRQQVKDGASYAFVD
jgi:hypothetical protein